MNPDFILENYRYHLPESQIAQVPADSRDEAQLLVLDRSAQTRTYSFIRNLGDFLPQNALLVVNNTKVIPARIYGTKTTGGKVEFLLLTPLPLLTPRTDGDRKCVEVEGLLRSSKSPRVGDVIHFGPSLELTVLNKGDFGKSRVQLRYAGELLDIFKNQGEMPLPPYIRRQAENEDKRRYQTVYARDEKAGSVAAPTAGLHFTEELRTKLSRQGITWAEVTLYVGYGTFSPVRTADIRDHSMHEEYIEIPKESAEAIRLAKEEGRPVVAVGTTSARSLEGMYRELGSIGSFQGTTDIFIYPGYKFQIVDKLLTNFHLPESSLIIMVAALAGRTTVLEAYDEALKKGFRFFSYGDAMLIS